MSIDTLAYSKTLEGAGLDRRSAEAHAEALTQHILPDLLTKVDLATAKADIEQAIERLDNRLDQAVERFDSQLNQAVERLENRMGIAIERAEHRITLRLIGIVGAFDAALFALLRFVH
jgi:hypothetical protein